MIGSIANWFESRDYRLFALNITLFGLVCAWFGNKIVLLVGMWSAVLGMLLYCKVWMLINLYKQVMMQKQKIVLSFYQISLVAIPPILVLLLCGFGSYLVYISQIFSWKYICGAALITFEALILTLICNEMRNSKGDWMKFLNQ